MFTVERFPPLVEVARRNLEILGCRNVHLRVGEGELGGPENAPYDAILVWAGGVAHAAPLRRQLALGGRLLYPVGGDHGRERLGGDE